MVERWQQSTAEARILILAGTVFLLDQLTKLVVVWSLPPDSERIVLDGFFRFVHWGNTGAAWSRFHGNNGLLALVALVAVGALWWCRRHFDSHRPAGQVALGLLFGGIVGNFLDRVLRGHVVDFLYFHVHPRAGGELGFAAFNVADIAICTAVGLLILLAWNQPAVAPSPE